MDDHDRDEPKTTHEQVLELLAIHEAVDETAEDADPEEASDADTGSGDLVEALFALVPDRP